MNPVRYTDPTGKDGVDGEPWNVIGIRAHQALATYMLSKKEQGWAPEYRFWDSSRADLMYFGLSSGSVWELKPVSYKRPEKFAVATIQLDGYVLRANVQGLNGIVWAKGSSSGNPKPFEQQTLHLEDANYTFSYWIENPESGILYYTYKLKKQPAPEPSTVPVKEDVKEYQPNNPFNIPVPALTPSQQEALQKGAEGAVTVGIGATLLKVLDVALSRVLCPIIIVIDPSMYQTTTIDPNNPQIY